jgi:tryptophan 2,3-dioxygenase
MQNRPDLEPSIGVDLGSSLTYAEYLCLDDLLAQQRPRSDPPHHDELLFIVQHQVAELWMKLVVYELAAAIRHVQADSLDTSVQILTRVEQIQVQLFQQWTVLDTLAPAEFASFRAVLGTASGLQSLQYRKIEFLLGNKDVALLPLFRHDPRAHGELAAILHAPSLYDEFLRYLARAGLAVPASCTDRDWSQPHQNDEAVVAVLKRIYDRPRDWRDAYQMCEKLVDVEEYFQLWRFRHVQTVERIIGHRRGTGGSSGIAFLRQRLDTMLFPELFAVRTTLGA